MHNFLIMGIPAKELKGQFNKKLLMHMPKKFSANTLRINVITSK